jgi:DmsE family decaheme c-type cytochrome
MNDISRSTTSKKHGRIYWSLVCVGILFLNSSLAQDSVKQTDESDLYIKQHADYSQKGADTCLQCHDEDSEFPVLDIFKTRHGNKADKHSPLGQLQCESCHGPAGQHSKKRIRKGKIREPMIAFERSDKISVFEKNKICSSCHLKTDKAHWAGSSHQVSEVACVDCHQIHVVDDPIQKKHRQVEVCGKCHQSQKLAANRFSSHPLKYGQQMGCTDCHAPHGSINEHLLIAETTNDTCFQCHAEKRGPFVWEHEPASEDCGLCHAPHGSNHKAMLVQKAPFLCQNCHSSQGHPSLAQDSSGLDRPFSSSSTFLLGRSCTNCHSKVHGSNHPSGSRLQR